jgi:hypothetical protein
MSNEKSRYDRYDDECTKLEIAVKQGQMTISGAVARAFILGANYQAEVTQETKENEAHGRALEAQHIDYYAIRQSDYDNQGGGSISQ